MSQAQLAELVDISVSYVTLIERGQRQPSIDVFLRIADVLGASLDDLAGRSAPALSDLELAALEAFRAAPAALRPHFLSMMRAGPKSASPPALSKRIRGRRPE